MMTFISVLELVFGMMIGFSGRNLFKTAPFVGGFMIGGVIGANIVNYAVTPPPGTEFWFPIAAFVVAGIIGGLIAVPLYMVMVILSSAAFGALVGAMGGFLIAQEGMTRMLVEGIFKVPAISPGAVLLMLAFAVVFGAASIRFDEFMLMASTGFVGAFIAASGLNGLFSPTVPVFSNSIFLIFLWLGLGTAGMIFQNQTKSD